ncbi:component of SCAR regulatory complex [Cavenderia fasciculata]|uniref:Component of SCAR regulatory complex n=1 Tax=Cavenderia fasciculata TaxID=261658 RepID=F4PJ73_CACFS|nr:component of SCAR regulatory complex [Cavenderia fasciculata]EGG24359.1 component of SCAR regulatory complex [Cavenderia fasciculata]|eukprot:XP_004362210.1 component of SCAR regulatory complex [Cavenderia fasciculata]
MSLSQTNFQKLPEKIHLVKENGEQLLHRLYNTRVFLTSAKTRPLFLSDEKIGRAIKNLMAKFPDFPELDKVQGVELLTSRAKQYVEDLEPHYDTLVDCCDWRDACFSLLQEISGTTASIKFTNSIQLAAAFMDLVVLYVKIHVLIGMIGDRRTVLGVFARLFQHIRSAVEPNYQRTVRWVHDFSDAPIKKLQDEFRAINDTIGHILASVAESYAKRKFITQLRRDGALNLILKPEDIARPIQDQYRTDLAYGARMNQWILFGALCAPGTLGTPSAIELVKFALSEGFHLPIFKDISFPIHSEFSSLFKNYKSKTIQLQKQRKVIKEATQASCTDAPRKHYEKRIYVRQELEAMYNLFRDRPCLLAPKFNVLLAALSMAKDEIFWYFRHHESTPPEKVKKYYNKQNDIRDKRISSLLYFIDKLIGLVYQNKQIIQNYYVEYIIGADLLGLTKILTPHVLQTAGTTVTQTINTIVSELKQIQGGMIDYNFSALRDNWMRLEYLLYSSSCSLKESDSQHISSRLNLVFIHSLNVDSIDQQLEEYSQLAGLWSFKDGLLTAFDQAIMEGADQPTQAMIFLRLLSQFPNTVPTQFFPEEKEFIGKECADLANGALNKIANRIVQILSSAVIQQFQANENQLADVNAAFPLLQKRKDWRPPKDFVTPVEPGSESHFKGRANLEQLRMYQKNAFQLCTALNEFMEISVHDHVFVPREFLRERMTATLKQYMRQTALPTSPADPTTLIRPSSYETQLHVFLGVLQMVENYVEIDVGDLIRETMLTEFYAKVLGKCGRIDWFPEGEIEYSDATLHSFTNYYTDFVAKKLHVAANQPLGNGVVYSPARLGYLSKTGLPFRAEDHTDLVETEAMVRLIGPYGVKLIERELLRTVLGHVTAIKDILSANMAQLEEYQQSFYKSKWQDVLKKFKTIDLDNFVSRSIAVGNALQLRAMLRDAIRTTSQQEIPYIAGAVDTAFAEYNKNTFMFPEFLGVDTIALDAGLDVGVADQYLKLFLRKISTEADKKLWEMLPIMYAVSFQSTFWKEATYRPSLEAYTNNINVLSRCINDLLIAFGAINSTTGNEAEIVVSLQKFVEISAVLIMRLFRGKVEKTPNDLPSVVVFLDKFVQDSPLISKDVLEQFLPYALIRNMYREIYEIKNLAKSPEGQTEQTF